jgi:hypothetical protein
MGRHQFGPGGHHQNFKVVVGNDGYRKSYHRKCCCAIAQLVDVLRLC